MTAVAPPRVLVIACGALARELFDLLRINRFDHVSVTCLPASFHNTPDRIPEAVRAAIAEARGQYHRILVGYADCGTGGALDRVCEQEGVERLPGAHCYELFAGRDTFAALHDEEPGTFYLTDYLAKHFDRLVIQGLGIDRHPELARAYFGNYRRVVHLAQSGDVEVVEAARRAAARLGLAFEVRPTGYGDLDTAVAAFARRDAIAVGAG